MTKGTTEQQDDITSLIGSVYATAVDSSGFAELLELAVDEIGAIRHFLRGESSYAPVLRLIRQDCGKPLLLRCGKCAKTEVLLCFGVDIPWHEREADAMRALYGLTRSENAVLGLLVEGHSPQETASLRSRSVETIRQQIKAMIAKTETAGLQDLLHLSRVVCVTSAQVLADRPEHPCHCCVTWPFLETGNCAKMAQTLLPKPSFAMPPLTWRLVATAKCWI